MVLLTDVKIKISNIAFAYRFKVMLDEFNCGSRLFMRFERLFVAMPNCGSSGEPGNNSHLVKERSSYL
jgi:hypothetical protein